MSKTVVSWISFCLISPNKTPLQDFKKKGTSRKARLLIEDIIHALTRNIMWVHMPILQVFWPSISCLFTPHAFSSKSIHASRESDSLHQYKHEKKSVEKQFKMISHILIFSLAAKLSPEKTILSSTPRKNPLSLTHQGTEVKIKTSLPH